MEIFAVALFAAMSLTASKLLDLVKLLQAGKLADFLTQTAAFGVGIFVAFLGSWTNFADGVKVGGFTFGALNAASLIFLGLMAGGTGSFAYDRFSKDTPSLGEHAVTS